jgi:hypothetical protein
MRSLHIIDLALHGHHRIWWVGRCIVWIMLRWIDGCRINVDVAVLRKLRFA